MIGRDAEAKVLESLAAQFEANVLRRAKDSRIT